jgi:hypothetical protein
MRVRAETCVFGKQSLGPGFCHPTTLRGAWPPHLAGSPFSRSYGGNLPSSLTGGHSIALVSSTCLPVSVCGTGTRTSSLRGFSGRHGSRELHCVSSSLVPTLSLMLPEISSGSGPHGDTHIHYARSTFPSASPPRSMRVVTEYKPFVHRLRLAASA